MKTILVLLIFILIQSQTVESESGDSGAPEDGITLAESVDNFDKILHYDVLALKHDILALKIALSQQELYNSRLEKRLTELQQSVDGQGSVLNSISANDRGAFSACPIPSKGYNANERVIFGHVLLDNANYDQSTGIYTCKTPGNYIFSVHIVFYEQDSTGGVDIVKNSEILAVGYANNKGTGSTGSSQVVTECLEGDQVYVRSRYDNTYIHRERFSIFSGYMLTAY